VSKLPASFSTFHNKIVLGKTQESKINDRTEPLIADLQKHYDLTDEEVFLQGSYPNGTAVKPDPEGKKGEYDVDLVCVSASDGIEPEAAIEEMEDALDELGRGDRFDRDEERPCVRLIYADDPDGTHFHIDVVPARESSSGEAPLEIPRPGHGWHDSDPAEYTKWCEEKGDPFARTVQMLKRWRDHNQDARAAVKSIILQVLIHKNLDQDRDDGPRIAATLGNISDALETESGVPVIKNPVLESEDLGKRWDEDDFNNFKKLVKEAAGLAEGALNESDESSSTKGWQKLFGKDFPDYKGGGGSVSVPSKPAPGTKTSKQSYPTKNDGWGR